MPEVSTPVSYTHLDVYKRQLLRPGAGQLCAGCSGGSGRRRPGQQCGLLPDVRHGGLAVCPGGLDVYKRQELAHSFVENFKKYTHMPADVVAAGPKAE